jgi:hypothetical protein
VVYYDTDGNKTVRHHEKNGKKDRMLEKQQPR